MENSTFFFLIIILINTYRYNFWYACGYAAMSEPNVSRWTHNIIVIVLIVVYLRYNILYYYISVFVLF